MSSRGGTVSGGVGEAGKGTSGAGGSNYTAPTGPADATTTMPAIVVPLQTVAATDHQQDQHSSAQHHAVGCSGAEADRATPSSFASNRTPTASSNPAASSSASARSSGKATKSKSKTKTGANKVSVSASEVVVLDEPLRQSEQAGGASSSRSGIATGGGHRNKAAAGSTSTTGAPQQHSTSGSNNQLVPVADQQQLELHATRSSSSSSGGARGKPSSSSSASSSTNAAAQMNYQQLETLHQLRMDQDILARGLTELEDQLHHRLSDLAEETERNANYHKALEKAVQQFGQRLHQSSTSIANGSCSTSSSATAQHQLDYSSKHAQHLEHLEQMCQQTVADQDHLHAQMQQFADEQDRKYDQLSLQLQHVVQEQRQLQEQLAAAVLAAQGAPAAVHQNRDLGDVDQKFLGTSSGSSAEIKEKEAHLVLRSEEPEQESRNQGEHEAAAASTIGHEKRIVDLEKQVAAMSELCQTVLQTMSQQMRDLQGKWKKRDQTFDLRLQEFAQKVETIETTVATSSDVLFRQGDINTLGKQQPRGPGEEPDRSAELVRPGSSSAAAAASSKNTEQVTMVSPSSDLQKVEHGLRDELSHVHADVQEKIQRLQQHMNKLDQNSRSSLLQLSEMCDQSIRRAVEKVVATEVEPWRKQLGEKTQFDLDRFGDLECRVLQVENKVTCTGAVGKTDVEASTTREAAASTSTRATSLLQDQLGDLAKRFQRLESSVGDFRSSMTEPRLARLEAVLLHGGGATEVSAASGPVGRKDKSLEERRPGGGVPSSPEDQEDLPACASSPPGAGRGATASVADTTGGGHQRQRDVEQAGATSPSGGCSSASSFSVKSGRIWENKLSRLEHRLVARLTELETKCAAFLESDDFGSPQVEDGVIDQQTCSRTGLRMGPTSTNNAGGSQHSKVVSRRGLEQRLSAVEQTATEATKRAEARLQEKVQTALTQKAEELEARTREGLQHLEDELRVLLGESVQADLERRTVALISQAERRILEQQEKALEATFKKAENYSLATTKMSAPSPGEVGTAATEMVVQQEELQRDVRSMETRLEDLVLRLSALETQAIARISDSGIATGGSFAAPAAPEVDHDVLASKVLALSGNAIPPPAVREVASRVQQDVLAEVQLVLGDQIRQHSRDQATRVVHTRMEETRRELQAAQEKWMAGQQRWLSELLASNTKKASLQLESSCSSSKASNSCTTGSSATGLGTIKAAASITPRLQDLESAVARKMVLVEQNLKDVLAQSTQDNTEAFRILLELVKKSSASSSAGTAPQPVPGAGGGGTASSSTSRSSCATLVERLDGAGRTPVEVHDQAKNKATFSTSSTDHGASSETSSERKVKILGAAAARSRSVPAGGRQQIALRGVLKKRVNFAASTRGPTGAPAHHFSGDSGVVPVGGGGTVLAPGGEEQVAPARSVVDGVLRALPRADLSSKILAQPPKGGSGFKQTSALEGAPVLVSAVGRELGQDGTVDHDSTSCGSQANSNSQSKETASSISKDTQDHPPTKPPVAWTRRCCALAPPGYWSRLIFRSSSQSRRRVLPWLPQADRGVVFRLRLPQSLYQRRPPRSPPPLPRGKFAWRAVASFIPRAAAIRVRLTLAFQPPRITCVLRQTRMVMGSSQGRRFVICGRGRRSEKKTCRTCCCNRRGVSPTP
ncbi:unnamed protein product [Amoebophrya sp. A120]|nr:unnamed protein product [Amoebophrya sp. A120]|eukprot:GSA120T00000017001.1